MISIFLKQKAIRYLANREHSRFELRRKLMKNEPSSAMDVDALLQELADTDLQSDSRFAESYASARARRGYGSLRIRNELQQRGVSEELIGKALKQSGLDFEKYIHKVHDKKFGNQLPTHFEDLFKREQFLEYRGFTREQIKRFFKGTDS